MSSKSAAPAVARKTAETHTTTKNQKAATKMNDWKLGHPEEVKEGKKAAKSSALSLSRHGHKEAMDTIDTADTNDVDMVLESITTLDSIACEDDPKYTFPSWNGLDRSCSWIVETLNKIANRRKIYCPRSENGQIVGDACPKSCEYCTINPTYSPSATNSPTSAFESKTPNLVMIITDQHNLRTISSYRNYLLTKHNQSKVDIWGDDVQIDTPILILWRMKGLYFPTSRL